MADETYVTILAIFVQSKRILIFLDNFFGLLLVVETYLILKKLFKEYLFLSNAVCQPNNGAL